MLSRLRSNVRISGMVVGCGLIGFSALPIRAVAGSIPSQQSQHGKEFEPTPVSVVFRVREYKVKDEKVVALCTNFAQVVQKPEVPVVVERASFEASISTAEKDHSIKLWSSPVIKSLVGMPACLSIGDLKTRFSVRLQADISDGRVTYRFMTSALPFNTEDKSNPFWSDKVDGPFELKHNQSLAIYNKGTAGKGGVLTTFDVVLHDDNKPPR